MEVIKETDFSILIKNSPELENLASYSNPSPLLHFIHFCCSRNSTTFKSTMNAGHQWLTPVILATQEAEIRSIEVQSSPGK
jgi:hypothetical protein